MDPYYSANLMYSDMNSFNYDDDVNDNNSGGQSYAGDSHQHKHRSQSAGEGSGDSTGKTAMDQSLLGIGSQFDCDARAGKKKGKRSGNSKKNKA